MIGEGGAAPGASLEPIFVRHRTAHLAAALLVPARARKLAVLLQGFGTSRSHRNRLWTMTAAALAERGIASVRFDYPGMGDSTGSRNYGFDDPPLDAARRVIDVAREAVQMTDFAVAGNCLGARMALAIGASDPSCTAAGVVLPGTLEGIVRVEDQWPADRLGTFLDKRVVLARAVGGIYRRRAERRLRLAPDVSGVLRTKPLLILYIGPTSVWSQVESALRTSARRLGPDASARATGIHVPTEGRVGLQSLPSQAAVRSALVDWLADEAILAAPEGTVPSTGGTIERRAG